MSSVPRAGVHRGQDVKAFVNTVPSDDRRSIFGVGMSAPRKPNAHAGHWSVRINKTFCMIRSLVFSDQPCLSAPSVFLFGLPSRGRDASPTVFTHLLCVHLRKTIKSFVFFCG